MSQMGGYVLKGSLCFEGKAMSIKGSWQCLKRWLCLKREAISLRDAMS